MEDVEIHSRVSTDGIIMEYRSSRDFKYSQAEGFSLGDALIIGFS
jgi:hypothetical protein